MLIFPAIDLFQGCAVRLLKGDYTQKTVYSRTPVSVAQAFRQCGATHIHLVDLEGAKSGETPNFSIAAKIKRETGLFCQVGGGIRSMKVIEKYMKAGIDRVILGTAAVEDQQLLKEAVARYGEKIAVGVDIRDGEVAIKGWTESSGIDGLQFCRTLQSMGVRTIICTDISRDGAMRGTNRKLYQVLSGELHLDIVASGGVSSMEDVVALKEMGLYAAIIGKAYYTGAISLPEVIAAAEQ